jgi:hypothetical protein
VATWEQRKKREKSKAKRRGKAPNDVVDIEHVDGHTDTYERLPWVQVDRRLLGAEDLQLRRTILAAESLTFAAELLQWPLSRLSERLRRQKQAAWWREVKARWSDERRRERAGRARERRRERRRRCPP